MASKGRKVKFHGAFASKQKAVAKERRTKGAYLKKFRVKGQTRWAVISRR